MTCNRMDRVRVDRRNHREVSYAGPSPGGFIITTLLGIAGALVGGFLGGLLGLDGQGDPVGYIMAVIGSIVLLLIYRMASRHA